MDSLDDPENTAKVSDSAYSTSCSNSQSRRSSKSTHSGSHSSRSSGYCGKPASSGSNKLRQPSDKRSKGKDGKKKSKLSHVEVHVESAAEGEARPKDLEEKPETGYQKIKRKYAATAARALSPLPGPAADEMDMTWNSGNGKEALITSSTAHNHCFNCCDPQDMATHNRGFSCVISMHDGVVMCTTSTITCTLGFPKDMWIGRAFIDFVHPKDRQMFASQIVSGVIIPKDMMCESPPAEKPARTVEQTMYCRIRTYRNVASGFCIEKGIITFLPFAVNLTFKDVSDDAGKKAYLLLQSTLLSSAYTTPFEPVTERTPFTTRHIANGRVQYIDRAAVPFLGYLPQDICDQDMLMLYHPDDLGHLLQVYDTVLETGDATKSQVYRMQAQNGNYVKLETEFSSCVNPCSKKLEYINGKHCVVQGPDNPDVFQTPTGTPVKLPEEQKYKAQILRDTIVKALNETHSHSEAAKLATSRRRMELAKLMESYFQEKSRSGEELLLDNRFERDSVMLGGISPHHENESKSGTGTPISYDTLNYYETLQRYFDSYLRAIEGNRTDKSDQAKTKKPAESSASVKDKEFAKMSAKNYHLRRLTEGVLIKHNTIMKKHLIKKQREQLPPGGENRTQATKSSRQKKRNHMGSFTAPYRPPPTQGIPETACREAKRPSWQCDIAGPARRHHFSWAERTRTAVPSASLSTRTTHSYVNTTAAGGTFPAHYVPTSASTVPVANAMPSASTMPTMTNISIAVTMPSYMSNIPIAVTMPTMSNMPFAANMPMMSATLNASTMPTMSNMPFAATMPMMSATLNASTMPTMSNMPFAATIPTMANMPFAATMPTMSNMPFAATIPTMANMPFAATMPTMSNMPFAASIPTMANMPFAVTMPTMSNMPFAENTPTMLNMPTITSYQNVTPVTHYEPVTGPHLMYGQSVFDFPFTYSHSGQIPPAPAPCMPQPIRENTLALAQENFEQQSRVQRRMILSSSNSGLDSSDQTAQTESDEPKALAGKESVKWDNFASAEKTDGESSFSSFSSSFFKTDSGSNEESDSKNKQSHKAGPDKGGMNKLEPDFMSYRDINPPKRKGPPWTEEVNMTSELRFKYQMKERSPEEVLAADKARLEKMEQPALVNEQLSQLYLEMQLNGLPQDLALEEGITSSSSSGEEHGPNGMAMKRNLNKTSRRKRDYSRLVMIYEEDAPIPSEPKDDPVPSTSGIASCSK